MRIRLISSDKFLYKLCQEVLLGFRNRVWDLGMVASYEEARGRHLFLWDLPVEAEFPEGSDFGAEQRCVNLVSRRQLKFLQRRPKLAGLSLVLKPVNPVLLRALLEEALSQYQSRRVDGQAAEQLRLERDELLQHLLHANLKLQEYDQDRTNFLAHRSWLLLSNTRQPDWTANPEQTKFFHPWATNVKAVNDKLESDLEVSSASRCARAILWKPANKRASPESG
jgi:hypothetical protein